jgi:acetyl-CoA acetyltransferase
MTTTMKDGIAIIGIAETPPIRRSDQPIGALVCEAVAASIADAGLLATDIDAIIVEGGTTHGLVPPDDVARWLGMPPETLTCQLSIGGAGIVGAPILAESLIASGAAKHVLCYFGTNWGSDRMGASAFHTADLVKAELEVPTGFGGQPVYFGAMANRYRHEFGLDPEDLAGLVISTRSWAGLHPEALKRDPLNLDDYCASPLIADPLRNLDMCLLTDGAAAFVMSSTERALDCPERPVYVAGCSTARVPVSQHSYFSQNPHYLSTSMTISGPNAFGMAGIAVSDVDFAEIYDCSTISCILQLESLGLCEIGGGASFVRDGRTGPGGAMPINTHGGLLSHAYLVGISHVIEAVRQLRKRAGHRQVNGDVGVVTGYSGCDTSVLVLTS